MAQYNIGNIYFAKKQFENAIDKFKKATEINPHIFLHITILVSCIKKIRKF